MEACSVGGKGLLVVVVGPSGAGKDTLMRAAAEHFEGRPDVHFVQRAITRPAEAGGEAFIDGERIPGAIPLSDIEKKLASLPKK